MYKAISRPSRAFPEDRKGIAWAMNLILLLRYMAALFGKWPYKAANNLVKKLARYHKLTVWPRNSFVTGALEPGYSDLDLTVIREEKNSSVGLFRDRYRNLKIFFPMLGEVNFYSGKNLQIIAENQNSFELKRDPMLVRHFQLTPIFTAIEAAVFLLRQLEKDLHNLRLHPEKRIKKWQSHFSAIKKELGGLPVAKALSLDEKNLKKTIVGAIIHLTQVAHIENLNTALIEKLNEKLNFLLHLLEVGINLSAENLFWTFDDWFVAWSPHRIVDSERLRVKFDPDQHDFFIAQMKWELCGALTQSDSDVLPVDTKEYLIRLKSLIEKALYFNYTKEMKRLLATYEQVIGNQVYLKKEYAKFSNEGVQSLL